jgi:secondary thiamine-phosphate synthase enzyme
MVKQEIIEIQTHGDCQVLDVTEEVDRLLKASGIKDGIVVVFVPGATGGITTIEFESGLVRDVRELMDKIIPQSKDYYHNMKWGDSNGHAHLRASLLGPSLSVPVSEGQMTLGIWQQIVFVDFDNRSRTRRLIVQMVGE